jgi:hypothetical protein
MMRAFVMIAFLSSPAVAIAQAGAEALFYNPADLSSVSVDANAGAGGRDGLRPISPSAPFPARGHVGIHYWLETARGEPLTEDRAAREGERFTLHIRSNTDGYLSVWLLDSGRQLTPMQNQWPGYQLPGGQEYIVPGSFRLARSSESGLVVLFARSQTEQVDSAEKARRKLEGLSKATGRAGLLALITETDRATARQVGTYVVNRDGGQPAAIVRIVP